MHDLTVDEIHTYYVLVADDPVLVHNIGGKKGGYGERCELFFPGPNARESIGARGPERDFNAQEIRDINEIGDKYGCHSCSAGSSGFPSGTWVKDHQPVSTFIIPMRPQLIIPQILLPHCRSCSNAQGVAARQMNQDGINPYADFVRCNVVDRGGFLVAYRHRVPWSTLRVEGLGHSGGTPEIDFAQALFAVDEGCLTVAVAPAETEVEIVISSGGAPVEQSVMFSGSLPVPDGVLEVGDLIGDEFSYRFRVPVGVAEVVVSADFPEEAGRVTISVDGILGKMP